MSFSVVRAHAVLGPPKSHPLLAEFLVECSDNFSNKEKCSQFALVSVNYCGTLLRAHCLSSVFPILRGATKQNRYSRSVCVCGGRGAPLSVPYLDVRPRCLNPLSTYLWPLEGAGVGRHHGQEGMQRPRRSRAAGPFLSKWGPILSAFSACSLQYVVQEGSNRGLC